MPIPGGRVVGAGFRFPEVQGVDRRCWEGVPSRPTVWGDVRFVGNVGYSEQLKRYLHHTAVYKGQNNSFTARLYKNV